ncbi:hypothetical protein [Rhodoferax ferrireducens]|uniref:hypothetical protein n=1 Tax=Rhodoferax ferrireducens TaxID=192843 RepID=UPI000E0DD85E|nr:hypothetical protein [Rhodoferax ferrireducens]
MRKAKSTRTWIATFVALCLLFAQIATAAYACPQLLKQSVSMIDGNAVVMADCDSMSASQMDEEQPSLCKAYCESGLQSHESKNSADVQLTALDVLWSLVWIFQPALESAALAVPVTQTPERPPGSPPLYLVHQVFRL